jgi:peroxiredoxin
MSKDYFKRILAIFFLSAAFVAMPIKAQTPVLLQTQSLIPYAFDLASAKGKVVFVFHWSTDCAVCLDKMSELRSNAKGWSQKAFVIVAVNHDKSRDNFQRYIDITKVVKGEQAQIIHVFGKDLVQDSLYSGGKLPMSYVLDDKLMLKHSYMGRIPAEAWDLVAELLP